MTLTMPNLRDSVRQERVDALTSFRFTERQARFLVTVLIHSGVFVPRQYRAFARIAHGQKTHDFLAKLVGRGYAKAITPGALHRGRLYHVQYKPLYRAIGEPDNRHRKPAVLGRSIERLRVSWPLRDGRLNTPTLKRFAPDAARSHSGLLRQDQRHCSTGSC